MTHAKLTEPRVAAKSSRMRGTASGRARKWLEPLVLAATIATAGCVTVEAPDKPIVIELNINIRQEVIYRLAEDAGQTIDENADIF